MPKSTYQVRLGRSLIFAERMRKHREYQGQTEYDDLKGKMVEYIDLECKIRISRVIKVSKLAVTVQDVVREKHTVHRGRITGAYARKGAKKIMEVKS